MVHGEHAAGSGDAAGLGDDGGGYENGNAKLGKLPTDEEFGGGWDFNYDEVLRGGKGRSVYLHKTSGSQTWGRS